MNKQSKPLTESEIKLLLIIGAVVVVMLIVVGVVWAWMRVDAKEKARKKARWLAIAYRMLVSFPLTKAFTIKCYLKLRRMAVQTEASLKRDATVTTLKALLLWFLVSICGMFIISDTVCRAMMFVLGGMVANRAISRRVDTINNIILNRLSGYIGLVREEYLRTESILESLQHAEVPPVLKSSIEGIIEIILTAAHYGPTQD